ncbi:MAG: ACT domain-containing protein [Pseudomonadota bacterium]
MIAGMNPVIRPGAFVFAVSEDTRLSASAFAVIREDEGTTLILPENIAAVEGLETTGPFACITLQIHSALDGVGLTAAVSAALAAQDIPANVVAGAHHDHIFVPIDRADDALTALRAAQSASM